ncbi:MAG: methylenetetrahydrofolate reductase [NAD(P)H] [Dongiaceae bacterium]
MTIAGQHETPTESRNRGEFDDLSLSFELFPPRAPKAEGPFWQAVTELKELSPRFVSVTHGAGGSAPTATHDIVVRLRCESGVTPAAHMTCAGQTKAAVQTLARSYWDSGVRHIVALRGDAAPDGGSYEPHPDGYTYAADLVEELRKIADFDISVAAYPEMHPEALDAWHDIDNLKRKLDAGAQRAITQFFFDPETYLRFVDRARAAGIDAPIVPGIMPILDFKQICRFAERCNAKIPAWLHALFDDLDDNPDTRRLVAAVVAAELCRQLYLRGVREFHFYTLNRSHLTSAICRILRNPVLRDSDAMRVL